MPPGSGGHCWHTATVPCDTSHAPPCRYPVARSALDPCRAAGRAGHARPFAIDTYLPAFSGIAKALDATPLQMQQTLSAYLFGFAFMNLFHGALADSFGRRPVILWGWRCSPWPRPAARCRRTSASWCSSARCKACPPAQGGGLARHRARHLPAHRGPAGDEPDHHLLRRGPGHRPHHGRLAVRAPGLGQHLLAADRHRRGAAGRQLAAAARIAACQPAPAL
jgi:hypothetical protein